VRLGFWAIGATGFVAACTSLSGLNASDDAGSSADAAPGADAPSDAGGGSDTSADVTSDTSEPSDGAVNLLKNPGFEQSLGNGCTDWTVAFGGTAVLSDVARTGAHSCLVCPNDQVVAYSGLSQYGLSSANATTYYAEVWLRAPDNGQAPPNTGVVLYETLPDGGPQNHQGNFVVPSSTWGLSTITATAGATGDKVQFEMHGYFPDGGCVLVDDAALYAR